ncbi:lipopolysaccharide biosynthesis protein [Vibrio sp. JC009]|uniref:lipopolysaccharide biosynthesis protein n=1 Tax=Vibrio sp. JC009 TaxID=2912314 RepID=UPI0023AEF172|nr:lipopolysaccharide biosynthesis protein [Vibrio sp. JC009]WED24146.1 lipopolysaccharide biosynthesis protein [Vibrio sp. JC009]
MGKDAVQDRFNNFRKGISRREFNRVDFLVARAEQFKAEDPELAKRILTRVENLRNQVDDVSHKSSISGLVESENRKANQKIIVKKQGDDSQKSTTELNPTTVLKRPFILFVLIPTVIFSIYQIFLATERFESQAKVIVQQPDGMATLDASMALFSGLGGVPTGNSDTELVKAYVYSFDMVEYLNDRLNLRTHFSMYDADYFSRIHEGDSREKMLEFYKEHIEVQIDEKSGVVSIFTQGFTPEYAQLVAETIVKRAEWYINSIGHQLAEAQLKFVKGEHQIVEDKLADAQTRLLKFQQKYNLLDPTAEGLAMQQITYTLEGQISAKEAELKASQSVMSSDAPQVIALKAELTALKSQLKSERSKLSQENGGESIPVSEILAKYTDLKVKMELALQSYTASQVSLEKSRIEAYRQMKYLITVESATLPEESKYPNVFYNITLFLVVLSMTFAIGKIVLSTIRELK